MNLFACILDCCPCFYCCSCNVYCEDGIQYCDSCCCEESSCYYCSSCNNCYSCNCCESLSIKYKNSPEINHQETKHLDQSNEMINILNDKSDSTQ